MPFVLRYADFQRYIDEVLTAIFQRFIDEVLIDFTFTFAFIDDVIIARKTMNLKIVLNACSNLD